MRSIWIGYDPREADGYAVVRASIRRHAEVPYLIMPVSLSAVRHAGLYRRPTSCRDGKLWDDISEAAMSTEFAVSRFLVPRLAGSGWALFADCDVLVRKDIGQLFDMADDRYAAMCVKHAHVPTEATKMGGHAQTHYPRKNWSSVVLYNCDHPANKALTVDLINTVPGRDLHRFCWLADDLIGDLPVEWNWLAGVPLPVDDPALVHFTLGIPSLPDCKDMPYADEWRDELSRWLEP